MGSKGTNTTTNQSTNTTAPDPNAYQAYLNILNQANSVGSTPYQAYTGEQTAPINAQQQAGISGINANANFATPYIQSAAATAANASQPLSASAINQYLNPYTQQVVNATQAQFANQNAQQLQSVRGNATAQGALGGDREAVAEAETTNQQNLAQNPVIAGLYSSGYQNAVNTAQGQQQIGLQGASTIGNLGVAGQNAALTGAQAQFGAGTAEQTTQQAADTAAYNQYLQQQAFPYQQLGWEAGIDTGVGSQLGGTSTGSGSTTAPAPNQLNSILGGGIALAGIAAAPFTGGASLAAVPGGVKAATSANGGRIPYAGGGTVSSPYGDVQGYIPTIQITHGNGAPQGKLSAPGQPQQQGASKPADLSGLDGLSGLFKSAPSWGPTTQGGTEGGLTAEALPSGIGGIGSAKRGGRINNGIYIPRHHFADGGVPLANDDAIMPGPQEVDPAAMARWRAGVDADRGVGMTANAPVTPVPASAIPMVSPATAAASADDLPPGVLAYGPGAKKKKANPLAGIGTQPIYNQDQKNPLDAAADVDDDNPDTASAYAPVDTNAIPSTATASPEPSAGGFLSGLGNVNFSQYSVPLIAAGLGIMSSRSPFLGEAIGQGGLQGLETYSGIKKQEADQQLSQQKLDMEVKKMSQAAEQSAKDLALRTSGQAETIRHNKETEDKAPVGMQYDDKNNLVPIPGYTDALKAQTEAKRTTGGLLDDDTINEMAEQALAGDRTIYQNLGRGAQGAENIVRLRQAVALKVKKKGGSGADQAAAVANFNAQTAAARSAAVREANVASSVEEAKSTFPLALEASTAVPRTDFVPWNRLVQKVQTGTSSPELARFYTATQGVITAYSQAMARTGVSTVDGRHAAEALLDTAQSPEAYAAVIDQMRKEMEVAEQAPNTVRQNILARISGRPQTAGATTPSVATAPAPQIGDRKQFKQGVGVWNGTSWVPDTATAP